MLFALRLFEVLVAGATTGIAAQRFFLWWGLYRKSDGPLRKAIMGSFFIDTGIIVSSLVSLFYRATSLSTTAPFTMRDVWAPIISALYLTGLLLHSDAVAYTEELTKNGSGRAIP